MANFRYFWPSDNVAPNATVTTGGVEDTTYPLTNLAALNPALIAAPSKLAGASGDWILNFGSAQRVDAVVLWHNFDAALAYRVQMNATNSWGGPTVNALFAAPAKRANGYTYKCYHELTGVTGYSTGGFRYLRINVTGTNSVPLGLKILVFSRIRTTVRNIQWGWMRKNTQTGINMATDGRVRWPYDLTAAPRLFRADIQGKDADYAAMFDLIDACAGGFGDPVVIVPDPGVNDAWLMYLSDGSAASASPSVQIAQFDAPYQFTNVNPMVLAGEEVTAGDPEWT